jgi:hypothetical protein
MSNALAIDCLIFKHRENGCAGTKQEGFPLTDSRSVIARKAMSLGIGIKVIHYFAAGTILLLFGLINFVRRRCRQTIKI